VDEVIIGTVWEVIKYTMSCSQLTILASIIMFRNWDGQSGSKIVSEICSFIIVFSVTVLLHITKDYDRGPSLNMYTPLSPSLSTRLNHGNGELVQHAEFQNAQIPMPNKCLINI